MQFHKRRVLSGLAFIFVVAACAQEESSLFAPDDTDSPPALTAVLGPSTMAVALDIRPASCPNPLNPKSRGVLPAAILGTEGFDVSEIDVSSILLEGVPPRKAHISDVATARVLAPPSPDLKVVSFTGPSSGSLGGVVGRSITLRIANVGTMDVTTGFPVGFYVSSDPVITTSDRLLIGGREFVPSIGSGVERPVPLFGGASIAGDSPTGDVYLGVIVDEFNSVFESDESNNTSHLAIRIDASEVLVPGIQIDAQFSSLVSPPEDVCDCIDKGSDGIDDLMLHFPTQDLVASLGTLVGVERIELTISGKLLDGTDFIGVDCVIIVGGDSGTSKPNVKIQGGD